MTAKRSTNQGFTSFRILGKRAQQFFTKARSAEPEARRAKAPKPERQEHAVIRIPMSNVLRATLTVVAVGVGIWLLWALKDKLILLILAFFVASIIDPGVRMLERWGIPRGLAILMQYAVALFAVAFLLLSLTPIIAEQITDIARFVSDRVNAFLSNPEVHLPLLPTDINERMTTLARASLQKLSVSGFTDALERWGENLSSFAQGSFLYATKIAGTVVSFVVSTIVVMVLAFFIQIEKEQIRKWLRGFLPSPSRHYMDTKLEMMQVKIGQWARGQLVLGLVVGSLVFIALTILGMPYALTLAVLAGFTEFIPYMGPFIAAVPSVLIAMTEGGFLWALVVAGVYYVVQWCENNLIVPLVMKRAVGLSPIAIIFAMLVGVSFPAIIHPVLGILLSIPATTILAIFLEDLRDSGE